MRIVLLGMSGSGKGTQGAILARHFGVTHVSSGELLRAHVAEDTELGRQVRESLARGDLVPDDVVIEMIANALAETAASKGYVLDGFPRTLPQAVRAYETARAADATADAVVYLEIPDELARARLASRKQSDRVDDATPDAIERRLALFHKETAPLLDYYKERGILHTVDATQPVEVVTEAILDALSAEQDR